jgi:L-rhamnose mutarotase
MMDWTRLHTTAFLLRIRPGKIERYRRRHAEIRHEMLAALPADGVLRYYIFVHEPSLGAVGYMVRNRVPDPSVSKHSVICRWRAYMAEVLETQGDRPIREPLGRVFHMEPIEPDKGTASSQRVNGHDYGANRER